MYRFIRLWQIGLNFRSVVLFRFSINKLSVILLSVWRLSWENENRWSDHFLIVFFASLPHLISVPWKLTFTTTSLSLAIASSSDLSHLDYNLISTLCDLYPPYIMENPILFIFLRNTVLFFVYLLSIHFIFTSFWIKYEVNCQISPLAQHPAVHLGWFQCYINSDQFITSNYR